MNGSSTCRRIARRSVALGTSLLLTASSIAASSADPTANVSALQSVDGTLRLESVAGSYPADGATLVTFSGSIVDRDGAALPRPVDISLTTTAGTFAGADGSPTQPGFHVTASHSTFSAVLRAPTQAGRVIVTASAGALSAKIALTFTTALPAISAGVVDLHIGSRRTNFFAPLDTFLSDDTRSSASAALFAQGPIGQSELTAAFNNQYSINGDCSGLTPIYGSTHDRSAPTCRPRYPILGDSSNTSHVANSSDNVYLRFEHNANFAQWGDYDTSELAALGQTYAATTRNLHGAKVHYATGRFSVMGLFATNAQAFGRDIIAPNGTSGNYYLSRRLVVPGSENVTLELERLDRPGTVVRVIRLLPGVDYELDPIAGSVLFRQPIAQTHVDPETTITLVQHIAVTYEYDGGSSANALGGRFQYTLDPNPDKPAAIGISDFHDNMGARQFSLTSADVTLNTSRAGRLSAELTKSHLVNTSAPNSSGTAYRIEQRVDGVRTTARAFVERAGPNFVNDAAAQSFVAGQTRFGANVDEKVSTRTTLSLNLIHERERGTAPRVLTSAGDYLDPSALNLPGRAVDSRLVTVGAGLGQKVGNATLSADVAVNSYRDNVTPALDSRNAQAIVRAIVPLSPRFTTLAEIDRAYSGSPSMLYPDRAAVGVTYKVTDGVILGVTSQVFNDGAAGQRRVTSLDMFAQPKLGDNTDLTSSYSLRSGMNGVSVQQQIGLNQRIVLAKHIRGTIGFEHIDGSLFNLTAAGMQFAQPYAGGSSAAGLGLTGGTNYHLGLELVGDPALKAGAQIERSLSGVGSDTVVRLGVAGNINAANKVLLSYNRSQPANQLLGGLPGSSDFSLGLALRDPRSDERNVLFSYESRANPGLLPTQLLTGEQVAQQTALSSAGGIIGRDATLSIEGIQSVTARLEVYAKLAERRQQTDLSPVARTRTTLQFAQLRLRYAIGRRYDVLTEARLLRDSVNSYNELGYVGELGYLLSPNLRGAFGYSGGRIDRDVFSDASRSGLYLDVTMRIHDLWRH